MSYARCIIGSICIVLAAASARAQPPGMPDGSGTWWLTAPDGNKTADECFGNCGAGCSPNAFPANPCPGRGYWGYEVTSTLTPTGTTSFDTLCDGYGGPGTLWLQHLDQVQAWLRWTYYGHVADACISHDAECRQVPFPGCLFFDWIDHCDGDHDVEWSYDELTTGWHVGVVEAIGSCNDWQP